MSFLKNIFSSKKETAIKSYADFWQWFQQNADAFREVVKSGKDIETQFFDVMSPKLNQLNEGFYFVTGMDKTQTAELIFTAEGRVVNIAAVEDLVGAAPKIEGWKFTAHKPALAIEDVNINMSGQLFNKENISFYYNEAADFPDEIDITLVHQDFTEENKNLIGSGTFIFLDNLLGELNSVLLIDNVTIIGPAQAQKELIPIEKLNDFLIWRQKEFVEKYDGVWHSTENENYSVLQAELENGHPLIAIINTDVLNWDAKASHPWMVIVKINYDGSENNGLPNKNMFNVLDNIEDEIFKQLKDTDGYLNIGRQTCENVREIFIACREFRHPARCLAKMVKQHETQLELSFDIFKDKYWVSVSRFKQS
jgi:hypothetical protein